MIIPAALTVLEYGIGVLATGVAICFVAKDNNEANECIEQYTSCTNKIGLGGYTHNYSTCRDSMSLCEGQGGWPDSVGDGRWCP